MWPFSRREPMQEQEAVRVALAFLLKKRVPVTDSTPARAVFRPADEWTPYDRWLVCFETHPGCCPPDSVVEIKMPSRKPAFVPTI